MTLQTVEYLLRVRIQEPPDRQDVPEENRIGDVMFDWMAEIEMTADEVEIVSRTILAGPGGPSRIRCSARSLDPSRHYATSRRWTVQTPDGETIVVCSAACALSCFCHEGLPADVEAAQSDTLGEEGTAA